MSKLNQNDEAGVNQLQEEIEKLRSVNTELKAKIQNLNFQSQTIDKDFILKLENDIVSHFRAEKDVKDLMNLKANLGELFESDLTSRYNDLLKQREGLYMRILQIPTNEFYYEYLDVLFMKEKKTVNQIKLIENKPKRIEESVKKSERLVKTEQVKTDDKGQFFILPEFFRKNNFSSIQRSIKAVKKSRAKITNLNAFDKKDLNLLNGLKENKSIKINERSVSKNHIALKTVKKVKFKINTKSDARLPAPNWRPKPTTSEKLLKIKSSVRLYKDTNNRVVSYDKCKQSDRLYDMNSKTRKLMML